MNNNQNPQAPTHQLPDHRINEIQEQVRKLAEENQRLRGTIDYMAAQNQRPTPPQQTTEADEAFEPHVAKAITKKFEALISPVQRKYETHLGFLAEKNDLLEFQVKYGAKNFEKYQDKIKAMKDERARQNQWISAEDAYKHIFFEETQRKPQIQNQETQKVPAQVFNPYTNQWETTQPTQTPPVQTAPQPTQQQQVAPVAQTAPTNQIREEDLLLPPVADNPVSASAPTPTGTGFNLDAGDEKVLDAFASKYGDVPL